MTRTTPGSNDTLPEGLTVIPRAAEDDITPELYLYSVFQDHLLYADMKAVVAEMQRRQPANPDVAVMADYVRTK